MEIITTPAVLVEIKAQYHTEDVNYMLIDFLDQCFEGKSWVLNGLLS